MNDTIENIVINTTITNPLLQYTTYLQEQGKSVNTIKSYTYDVGIFFDYFKLQPTILLRDQIIQYKEYLQKVKNNNAKSINRILSSLKSYNEFLVREGLQENLVILSIDYIKVQDSYTSPTNVTVKETISFLNRIKKDISNDKYSFRNYAIATLIVNTGLRVSEALSIKIDGLTLGDNEIIVLGKGNKQRSIIINNKAIEVIQEYITNYRNKSSYANQCEYLFISNKGGKLRIDTIEKIFNKYSNKITPHSLRHRFSTSALEDNVLDVRQLQQQLGHKRVDTIMVYTHPTKEKMKQKLNGFSIG